MAKIVLPIRVGAQGYAWRYLGPQISPSLPSHHHEELEANLVTAGSATYVVGEEEVGLHPGSLLWLFPGQEHRLASATPDFRMWIVVFKPGLVQQAAARAPGLSAGDPGRVVVSALPARRLRALDMVARDLAATPEDSGRYPVGLTWWLLSAWEAGAGREDGGSRLHPAVACAMDLVRREPGAGLSSLAGEVGLSPSQLSRLFRRDVGVSLSRYRNRVRLEAFFKKREAGLARTMLETALDAGFGSYAQFNRVFRGQMGCTPMEYDRAMRPRGRGSFRRGLAG